jgi:hypothetical protein
MEEMMMKKKPSNPMEEMMMRKKSGSVTSPPAPGPKPPAG